MALGYNGGIGNLGVSISQLLAPICMSTAYGKDPVAPSGIPVRSPAIVSYLLHLDMHSP